jgi:Mannosyltransferase (PIG-V)
MFTFILLLLSFLVAKAALLAIVLGTTFLPNLSIPFISTAVWPLGYDSSSTVLLPEDSSKLGRIAAALFRWDSVYFISLADRAEYSWEQEWAFGPGWPMLIRYTAPCKAVILPSTNSQY